MLTDETLQFRDSDRLIAIMSWTFQDNRPLPDQSLLPQRNQLGLKVPLTTHIGHRLLTTVYPQIEQEMADLCEPLQYFRKLLQADDQGLGKHLGHRSQPPALRVETPILGKATVVDAKMESSTS